MGLSFGYSAATDKQDAAKLIRAAYEASVIIHGARYADALQQRMRK